MIAVQAQVLSVFPTHVGMNRTTETPTASSLVFPTHVGMNRIQRYLRSTKKSVPHARGDEPAVERVRSRARACSPRTWG